MTTSGRSLAEQLKFGRIFFIILLFPLLLRTTKIRQNLFCAFGPFIIQYTSVSSLYGSTRLNYPYPYRSRLSFLFSPIDQSCSAQPVLLLSTFVPTHYASSTSSIHPSTSSCCFDIPSTTVIVLRSWPSWACHVSYTHG